MIQLKHFRHIAIIAKDLDIMVNFYTQILGFEIKREFEIESEEFRTGINIPIAKAKGTHLQHSNLSMEIELFEFVEGQNNNQISSQANIPGYRHIAFVVEDLDQSYEVLKENGIEFFSAPITIKEPANVAGFQFVYFKDPEGNLIELNKLPENEM